LKLGVCYYPEHWPAERWRIDARLMCEAGLSIVRIGEFAWAKMEPTEGQYQWDWMDQAIQTLAAEGLQVVLGTPTATPPAWLVQSHPEILPVDLEGRRRRFSSRRHYCLNSPIYRDFTRRIVGAMAARYASHPSVIGWQIDNEFGCHNTARCYCDDCASAFRLWLQERYGNLEALNQAWGAVFWSQTYTDWDQVEPPILTVTEPNPSQVLDYYRFSSDSNVAYQQIQVDLLRQAFQDYRGQAVSRPDPFITHNCMGNFPDLNYHDLARPLDLISWDSYPTGYAEDQSSSLYFPGESRPPLAYDAGDPYVTGFCHDLTRGLKEGAPYWVMEQQCGNINWSSTNTGVRPGVVRLWTWHALASGAEAVVYFRWRASLYAQEMMHSGLLKHDASPGVGYRELVNMLPERDLMDSVGDKPYQADVALLLDYEDLWAIGLQPHRKDFGYLRHLFIFYRALAQSGIQADIVSYEADLGRYRLVIAPTAFLSTPERAEKLAGYARQGGSLLLGVRSGFKTISNLVTDQPLPGEYRSLAGVQVSEWHPLPDGTGYAFHSHVPGLKGPATFWAEALIPASDEGDQRDGLTFLATYEEGPFTGQGVLSKRAVGEGRVYYLGMHPTLAQARALLGSLADRHGIDRLPGLPEGVLSIRRGGSQVLLNFNEREKELDLAGEKVVIPGREILVR
jgi:beta-galactosidase